jgi:hypothetical protein
MSYLTLYADRRPTTASRTRRGARVDERTRLSLPGLYGDAYVRVFVEDTSRRKLLLRRVPPHPRLKLRIADCVNVVNLEFDLGSAELRENSLYKINTLLNALHRFRDGLAAEVDLFEQREGNKLTTKGGSQCRT